MSNFHSKFPFGKGIWIWELSACLNGDISAIIEKCKSAGISYVLIKCGDGTNTWAQWNKELVDQFHNAGIKIYSWSYIYGQNSIREAAIALWALDMGADGHVFDAESQYEHLPNNAVAATTLLSSVREKHPEAFLAYSPEPIIEYHQKFPYAIFGKYCDAVMPQVYFGEWKKSPTDGINWMYQSWSKTEDQWKQNGMTDSIKPIIPVCQTYDDPSPEVKYVSNPSDILHFIDGVKGYMSVNFWSFQHIIRPDCWDAIKSGQVNIPASSSSDQNINQNTQSTNASSVTTTTPEIPPAPVVEETVTASTESQDLPENSDQNPDSNTSIPPSLPRGGLTVDMPATIPLSNSGKTTITVSKDPKNPQEVKIVVRNHKPHIDYVIDFFHKIFHAVKVK